MGGFRAGFDRFYAVPVLVSVNGGVATCIVFVYQRVLRCMLLTLSVSSLIHQLDDPADELTILGVPRYAQETLGLNGLQVQTSLLHGWELERFDTLRDAADKAACPCLVLVEDVPNGLGGEDDDQAEESIRRLSRVLQVANRLGCSSVVVPVEAVDDEDTFEILVERLRAVVQQAERMEINLLIEPRPGLTGAPERLTELIRGVGGFRIGSCPRFDTALSSDEPVAYLKSITPYASVVRTGVDLPGSGAASADAFASCLEGIQLVGFDGTLAVECSAGEHAPERLKELRGLLESLLNPEGV